MTIEWLKNKFKQRFYPVTHAKAVIVDGTKTLETSLGEKMGVIQPAQAGRIPKIKSDGTLENSNVDFSTLITTSNSKKIAVQGTAPSTEYIWIK